MASSPARGGQGELRALSTVLQAPVKVDKARVPIFQAPIQIYVKKNLDGVEEGGEGGYFLILEPWARSGGLDCATGWPRHEGGKAE